jgi:ABC-type sugar transport system substrate-binding protein
VVQQHDQEHAAQLVQQTGSAYLQALSGLSQASNTATGAQGQQGREVAQAMLRAAADEVVRMSPNDPVATGILAAFDRAGVQRRAAAGPDTASKQSVVWF